MTTWNKISEGLEFGDLKGLVSNVVMIDMHKPKIGDEEDTVVIAFNVIYKNAAQDLSSFIETGALEHLDVEVAGAPDQNGNWKVFVEFMRDRKLFKKVQAMLDSVDQITSNDDDSKWLYRAYNVKKKVEFNAKNFRRDVVDSVVEYRRKYGKDQSQTNEMTNELEESWHRHISEYQKRNA